MAEAPLPLEILCGRLTREFAMLSGCTRAIVKTPAIAPETIRFPVEIDAVLTDVTAFRLTETGVEKTDENLFTINLRRDYPFSRPAVAWRTDIFHPNIASPAEGGFVCTRLLDEWRADRTLLSVVEGIANLVENPNILQPLGTDNCQRASRYFGAGGERQ